MGFYLGTVETSAYTYVYALEDHSLTSIPERKGEGTGREKEPLILHHQQRRLLLAPLGSRIRRASVERWKGGMCV